MTKKTKSKRGERQAKRKLTAILMMVCGLSESYATQMTCNWVSLFRRAKTGYILVIIRKNGEQPSQRETKCLTLVGFDELHEQDVLSGIMKIMCVITGRPIYLDSAIQTVTFVKEQHRQQAMRKIAIRLRVKSGEL